MKRVLQIIKREYIASVRTKGFIIGLVLAPVVMSGSGLAMWLLRGHVDTEDKKIAVVDRSGILADTLVRMAEERNAESVYDTVTGEKKSPAYIIQIVRPETDDPEGQMLTLSDRVRSGDLHSFVVIGEAVLHPPRDEEKARISYHGKAAAMDEIRGWINGTINWRLRHWRLSQAGIQNEEAEEVFWWVPVDPMGLVSQDASTGEVKTAERKTEGQALIPAVVLFFLMFIMIMMGAVPQLYAVVEEKSQRIAEVLLGLVTPLQFMAGKVLGGLAVSLTGSGVYLIGGIVFFTYMGLDNYIPFHVLPWFVAYMVLNIVMLGAIYSALGSSCSDPKDAQSIGFPAMLPVMIPMFLVAPVIRQPESAFATWASLFPPFTPTLMVLRMALPQGVPAWQPWVGLAGIILTSAIAVWAASRVFRVGLLVQGKGPKLGTMIRWAISG
ncbi:MAG: ABC transporter permease [Bacteroidota bacterium]